MVKHIFIFCHDVKSLICMSEMFQDTMIALMGAIFTIYFDEIVIEASHNRNNPILAVLK